MHLDGNHTITAYNAHEYAGVTSIGGYAYIHAACPALTSIGGYAEITADCPALTSIGGHARIYADCPALTSIEGLTVVPPVEQRANLIAVARAALATPEALCMDRWHKCATTHCIAGWAQHLSDDPVIKAAYPATAGAVLLGPEVARRFHDTDEEARAFLQSVLDAA